MGSFIEINDTLRITKKQGFPHEVLDFSRHIKNPIQLEDVANQEFIFSKTRARIYHLAPTRVYLVENIENKWLFWGKILILEQRIHRNNETSEEWITSGKFKIIDLYEPDYQKIFTKRESPTKKSYFK